MKSIKILALALVVFAAASCSSSTEKPAPAAQPAPAPNASPLGEMAVPPDNPITPDKVELGKKLFLDTRLSKTGMMSCETCHHPDKGWTDGEVVSARFDGNKNTRHTPTLYNVGYYKQWYWDGRAATLEAQILAAWKGQMSADVDQVVMKLNGIQG